MKNFKEYLEKVKEQLNCNATEEYKNNYVTFLYNNEDIDNNIGHFKRCMDDELSAYKSLLYFNEYLERLENGKLRAAEDVLREYIKFDDVNGSKQVKLLPLTIIDCMEEYAEQFQIKKITKS